MDNITVLIVEDLRYLIFPPVVFNDRVWFHHVMHVHMKNKELWFRDAIKHETVELILWNMMAKTS